MRGHQRLSFASIIVLRQGQAIDTRAPSRKRISPNLCLSYVVLRKENTLSFGAIEEFWMFQILNYRKEFQLRLLDDLIFNPLLYQC